MRSSAIAIFLALSIAMLPTSGSTREYLEIEAAHEVRASDIRIPSSGEGVVRVETCEDCSKLKFNITASTRAFVNEQPITIKQFRNLAMANAALAYVFYKPGTFEITRMVLDMPGFK